MLTVSRSVNSMKYLFIKAALAIFLMSFLMSCARRAGCPSNGKNVGAERLMSGEKIPKAKKFKS